MKYEFAHIGCEILFVRLINALLDGIVRALMLDFEDNTGESFPLGLLTYHHRNVEGYTLHLIQVNLGLINVTFNNHKLDVPVEDVIVMLRHREVDSVVKLEDYRQVRSETELRDSALVSHGVLILALQLVCGFLGLAIELLN